MTCKTECNLLCHQCGFQHERQEVKANGGHLGLVRREASQCEDKANSGLLETIEELEQNKSQQGEDWSG